jgi:glycosyltransferase involved in cell wall biosynthesis
MLRRVDRVIANGVDIAEHYRRRGLTVSVIENSVDLRRWQCDRPGLRAPLHVGFVGRLTESKGIEEFVQAARKLNADGSGDDFVFHIVGSGNYSHARMFLENQHLFQIHGSVSNVDLPQLVKRFDVCVALTKAGPYGGGGTSNALLEQMASGRVIIAWNNPIFRQLLSEDCAYLVDQGDVTGIIKSLDEILLDKIDALNRAKKAKQIAAKFSLDGQVRQFMETIVEAGAEYDGADT